MKHNSELLPSELKPNQILVDIREIDEVERHPYVKKPSIHLPLSTFTPTQLDPKLQYALFCQRGRRSCQLVETLMKQGIKNVVSIKGGIEGLAAAT